MLSIRQVLSHAPGRCMLLLVAACAFSAGPVRALDASPVSKPPVTSPAVGFATVQVLDPQGSPLDVGIWYPTTAPASVQRLGLFTQSVAPDGPVEAGPHPLVVISHGNGGSLTGHYDTALALAAAGFIVAAPTHTGDNYRDQSKATGLVDRPRHVRAVIDYMLAAWPGHASVDAREIGMFGFSSGGLTALVTLGGVPDLSRIGPYCATHGAAYVCMLLKAHPAGAANGHPVSWTADPRVRAAVIAAPALGFTFTPGGLEHVLVPIQLWRAEDDHVLPSPDYVEAVLHALPHRPEYHVVAGADHFDFLAPCSPSLAALAPMICREQGGFDRTLFHQSFDREVVAFFERTLGPHQAAQ